MASVNPYLTFNGNCEEAFNFYKNVFGGEFDMVMRMDEAPPSPEMPLKEEEKKMIMHMSLPLDEGSMLMGSDQPSAFGKTVTGTNFSISISAKSKEEADNIYNKLSAGGKATMPMDNAFWGSYFGMCTDKYGIQWMISFATAPQN